MPPYPPPGETLNLLFTDAQTLVWDPEKSVGSYILYRGLLSELSLSYGNCVQQGITTNTTPDTPPPDDYFYIVTAENRLEEEGTMGEDSTPAERPTPPCP